MKGAVQPWSYILKVLLKYVAWNVNKKGDKVQFLFQDFSIRSEICSTIVLCNFFMTINEETKFCNSC